MIPEHETRFISRSANQRNLLLHTTSNFKEAKQGGPYATLQVIYLDGNVPHSQRFYRVGQRGWWRGSRRWYRRRPRCWHWRASWRECRSRRARTRISSGSVIARTWLSSWCTVACAPRRTTARISTRIASCSDAANVREQGSWSRSRCLPDESARFEEYEQSTLAQSCAWSCSCGGETRDGRSSRTALAVVPDVD
jgi:hypothetical protein